MNILIVDDDAVCRLALGAALKKLGHQVTSARDGSEALTVFTHSPSQVIVSDQLMPGMDGLELCRRIRAADAPQYTYFILLTIMEGKAHYLAAMKAGADDFLTKPFDMDLLSARLAVAERVLNLQSELRQLGGLLPICSVCKKVRDDQNYWHQVESYISRHTDAQFTHSYCPDCFQKILNEVEANEPSASQS
jgi:phosphoserine phosphatase RsbU/P